MTELLTSRTSHESHLRRKRIRSLPHLANTADVIGRSRRIATRLSPDARRNRGKEKFQHDPFFCHRYDRLLSERADLEVDVAIEPVAL